PSIDPVGDVDGSIGSKIQTSRQYTPQYLVRFGKLEGGAFRLKPEGMDARLGRPADKLDYKKCIFPSGGQGCPRIIYHSGRTVDIIGYGRCNICCLTFKPGFIKSFIHPDFVGVVLWISIFSELPVNPPPCIRTIDNVNQPLGFS